MLQTANEATRIVSIVKRKFQKNNFQFVFRDRIYKDLLGFQK
jgi:hypothetical protein